MNALLPLLVLSLALFSAAAEATTAGRIAGSGEIVEDTRPITDFQAVRSFGSIEVRLKAADRESVTVRADDNIVGLIETTRVDGPIPALEIRVKDGVSLRTRRAPLVTVEFIALQELTLRGSGDLRADRVEGEQLAVSIAGSGDVRIDALTVGALAVMMAGSGDFRAAGRAEQQGYRITGSGDVEAGKLMGSVVKLGIAGSGDAAVHATQELEVTIAGSGSVMYRGSPRITQRIAGSGKVRPAR
jgi:hypothetical protein